MLSYLNLILFLQIKSFTTPEPVAPNPMRAAYGFHHTCAGFGWGFVDTHIVVSFKGNRFIPSFRDTVVTSFLCAHMLSVNVPVVMRQPMNFNGVEYGFELRGQIQKKNNSIFLVFFSPSSFLLPLQCSGLCTVKGIFIFPFIKESE